MKGSELAGKRAVVLGASSPGGLGEAIALALAEAGAAITVAGRSREGVAQVADERGWAWTLCDIADESQLAELAEAGAQGEGLDIAVNAAGTAASEPILKARPETLEQAARTHFVGTTLFFKQMARAMDDGGSLVTLSSLTAQVPTPVLAAYGGSKAAADYVVRVAALELGRRNIRVNAVAPGMARTRMTEAMLAQEAAEAAFARETPLGRLVTPEEVADAVLWLCAPGCFVTGEIISVSGGAQLTRLPRPEEMQ